MGLGRSIFFVVALVGVATWCSTMSWVPAQDGSQVMAEYKNFPWLFVADDLPKLIDSASVYNEYLAVEVILTGDVMLGRGLAGDMLSLEVVAPWLANADLAVGNFEGVFTADGWNPGPQASDPSQEPYRLDAPLGAAAVLQNAGFDLLSLANNHALDDGVDGLERSVKLLNSLGMQTIGAGPGPRAYQPVIVSVRGVCLAFLAFDAQSTVQNSSLPGDWQVADWNPDLARRAVLEATQQADATIVLIHWGTEYAPFHDPAQEEIAMQLLAAGADLVVGSHPHVVQGTQMSQSVQGLRSSRQQFVAYSLGNFAFDQPFPEARRGLALRALFDRGGLRAVQGLAVLAGERPHWDETPGSSEWVRSFSPPPVRLGFACDDGTCLPVDAPKVHTNAIFWNGQIDLTGDGQPEMLQRRGDSLAIWEGDEMVWSSPPEWQVLDVALGDPNDDGRYEGLVVARRVDAQPPTSHPYIVGYRGALYRLVWGGSAVADPIHEVELGDLDGDGVQEVVFLEDRDQDADTLDQGREMAITVWHWNGWGFSLDWRSLPGRYHDLILIPHTDGSMIRVMKDW